jgi:hypothetical protein
LPPPVFNTEYTGLVHFDTEYCLKVLSTSTHSLSLKTLCYNPHGNVFFTSDITGSTNLS